MSKLTLTALAAAAALPMALASGAAQAQIATYCNGSLVANSFYNNVQSNGRTSTVLYYVQLQNRTEVPLFRYTVRFTHAGSTNRQNGSVAATLPPYQQVTVLLGQQQFHNPSGTGALSPTNTASGVPHYTQVQCGFQRMPE